MITQKVIKANNNVWFTYIFIGYIKIKEQFSIKQKNCINLFSCSTFKLLHFKYSQWLLKTNLSKLPLIHSSSIATLYLNGAVTRIFGPSQTSLIFCIAFTLVCFSHRLDLDTKSEFCEIFLKMKEHTC